jgi:hypothetical protein
MVKSTGFLPTTSVALTSAEAPADQMFFLYKTYRLPCVEPWERSNNMIVGDKSRFAIEFELDQAKLADAEFAPWLFGRIRFWCCGDQVGQYEADTTIRDVVVEVERFIADEGKRHDTTIAEAARDEVVRTIVSALYVDSGQADQRVQNDADRFGPFVVSPEVDVFDPWHIFLVEGDRAARLIWHRKGEQTLHECALARGEFEFVLRSFLGAMENLATDLRPKFNK